MLHSNPLIGCIADSEYLVHSQDATCTHEHAGERQQAAGKAHVLLKTTICPFTSEEEPVQDQ